MQYREVVQRNAHLLGEVQKQLADTDNVTLTECTATMSKLYSTVAEMPPNMCKDVVESCHACMDVHLSKALEDFNTGKHLGAEVLANVGEFLDAAEKLFPNFADIENARKKFKSARAGAEKAALLLDFTNACAAAFDALNDTTMAAFEKSFRASFWAARVRF